jgi:capsular polysaccharide biosynthesis protein
VYGDPSVHPQREDYWGNVNPIGIRSCYDEGKRCAETLFFDYHHQHGLEIKVARIFNTYGPRMHPNDGRVVSNFIMWALADKPITLYGGGTQTRAFCYVDDMIRAITTFMDSDPAFVGPVNLGNPVEFTIRELAERVLALTGSRSRLVDAPLPQDDPVQRQPDITLARERLGWEPRTALDEGLLRTIEYFDELLSASGTSPSPERLVERLARRLQVEEPTRGRLIAAIDYKRTLVSRLGVEPAFRLGRAHLRVPGTDTLHARRVVPLRQAVEAAPGFVELWPGGERFVHAPPVVVGGGDHRELSGTSRSAYLGCLEDVLVRGRAAVVARGTEAIVDFENDELVAFADSPQQDPGVLHAEHGTYWMMDPGPDAAVPVVDEAFQLCGAHSNDFGHWLEEFLPRLAIARLAGLPRMTLLVDQFMPPTHFQSLALLCPDWPLHVVPHLAPVRVRKLWCAPNVVYRGWYPSEWRDAWEGMLADPRHFATARDHLKQLAAAAIAAPTGHPRLFMARRPKFKKKLVNHERIEALVAARGFHVVHAEDLPFAEQLRLAHHARHIVAPDGSAGLLSYFASPGTRVCYLNPPQTMPLGRLNGVLAGMGIDLTVFTGPVVGPPDPEGFWSDYAIDEARFAAFLDAWLQEPVAEAAGVA